MKTQRQRTTHRRELRITPIALVAAASLVACGGDNITSGSGTETSPSTAAPATAGATATTAAPADTTPVTDACDPIGTLTTLELNDRCVELSGEDLSKDLATVLGGLGYWVDQSCSDGALVVAQPHQVLVTVTDPGALDGAIDQVLGILPVGSAPNGDFRTSLSQVIDVPTDTQVGVILAQLPDLQGQGYSTDLNYLEPVQPNYGFRPAGDPQLVAGSQVPIIEGDEGPQSILVFDSTGDQSQYDVDGNGKVDEDHGHGEFVRSIIQQQAPGTAVTLQAVTSSANRLPSGRWVPMMFSDADLIRAMEPHFGTGTGADYVINKSVAVVNLSLGGAGCTTSGFGYGVGERVALAREMAAFSQFDNNMRFVAAAGNDHGYDLHVDFKHFPAAWRDQSATNALATQVGARDPTAGQQIEDIHAVLTDAMIAVAASDGLDYTNCGPWINAVAEGTEVGNYQTGLAEWSGTSFATANESALVAQGELPNDSLPCPPR